MQNTPAPAPQPMPAECVLAAAEAAPQTAAAALGLQQQHVLNLVRLARYLRAAYPQQGESDGFGMAGWYRGSYATSFPDEVALRPAGTDALARYECGTVACAVGHGPAAGVQARTGEFWADYTRRCFLGDNGSDYYVGLFRALFDAEWSELDDTPRGAAARICYALQHGADNLYPDEGMALRYREYVA